jgi:hypothetical protein
LAHSSVGSRDVGFVRPKIKSGKEQEGRW